MNVGPVQHSPSAADIQESAREQRASQAHGSSLGSDPIREARKPHDSAQVPPTVQDEVKLQWDASDQRTIYRFVNQQSGALILQVPSEQVLGVERGIQESMQKESLHRESLHTEPPHTEALRDASPQQPAAPLATAGSEGGKTNGS